MYSLVSVLFEDGEMENKYERSELIFDMVNGSLVDGYGIRTTIFLKGCPLKCTWCCNPEGQSFKQQLSFLKEHCNGCNGAYRCVNACPHGAISKSEDGKISIDRSLCDDCGECQKVCWFDALTMKGTAMTAKEVYRKISREKAFFMQSGGGLTIGGGEATSFPEFCLELIELCHADGIHVAIDSCGYMLKNNSIDVLLAADLVLFDIKGFDEEEHIQNTGVSMVPIWDTLRVLHENAKPVIVRIPMIPNYNYHIDSYAEMAEKMACFTNVERIDLLPFHEYGKSKYENLGMEYRTESHAVPQEEQELIKKIFEDKGFLVQLGG